MKRNTKTGTSIYSLVMTGMFVAVLAVLSQIQIPMPSGVPVTLQTFAVALAGFVLGGKHAVMALFVYVLVGAVGLPVFTGFHGGVGTLLGPTGGFIWGFFAMAALCGRAWQAPVIKRAVRLLTGLLICHLLGIWQFMTVMNRGFAEAALLVSVPYFIKDALSVAGAYAAARAVRRRLYLAGFRADEMPGN